MAQSIELPTLDFGSGCHLGVMGWEPHVGLHTEDGVGLGFSLDLSLFPSAPPLFTLSVSKKMKF